MVAFAYYYFRENEIVPTKRLFIGGIPFRAQEQDVRDFFSPRELYDVKIIIDRETGNSRGFGFVELDEQDAETALRDLDGGDFGGRTVAVKEANERPARGNGSRREDRHEDRGRRDYR